MSTTTTYGYKKPENGDRGTWWDDMNDNTDRLDAHTHDGTDSAPLPPTSITKEIQTISSGDWVATSGGLYQQTITLPTGYAFSTGLSVKFYEYAGGAIKSEIAMQPVWASDSTYVLETNDNTLNLRAIYA